MPIWLDKRYANMLSPRLENFKWKKPMLANFRCPYCGDSQKKTRKARGYIYENEGNLFFKCWNCSMSTSFSRFLEFVSPDLYRDYRREIFITKKDAESNTIVAEVKHIKLVYPQFDKLKFCSRLTQLSDDHPARVYIASRFIPQAHYINLFYTDTLRLFVTSNFDASQEYLPNDPAVIILIRDEAGHIVGCNCRSLNEAAEVKYIKAKLNEDITLIYGIEKLQKHSKIYVFEGEFNSMFVENAVAVGGVGVMSGIENTLHVNKEQIVQVVDNDPRNPQVVKILQQLIDEGYNVVIMPGNVVHSDVNDIVKYDKLSIKQIKNLLDGNIFSGLSAKLKLSEWRRC